MVNVVACVRFLTKSHEDNYKRIGNNFIDTFACNLLFLEIPDNDGTEQGMEEGEEESPEGDGQEEQFGDEDPEAEEPQNLKDEL